MNEHNNAYAADESYSADTRDAVVETYVEEELPMFLRESIRKMQQSWEIEESGGTDLRGDILWCDLYADIRYCETEHLISPMIASYLREKYLRMPKNGSFSCFS